MSFHVGQKVLCIDDHRATPFLEEGKTYTVEAISKTPCCNQLLVSVGSPSGLSSMALCLHCGRTYSHLDVDHYYRAARFIPAIEAFKKVTLEKVLEQEPVSAS